LISNVTYLFGLKFWDKNNNIIAEIGDFWQNITSTFELCENEKILAVRGKTKNPEDLEDFPGDHIIEFQFVIMREVKESSSDSFANFV
jgi:hypothetical protein